MMRESVAIKSVHLASDQPEADRRFAFVEGWVADAGPPSGPMAKGCAPRVEVRIGEERIEAARAASCLVAPGPGDRVVVARSGGEAFVLAVLTRGESPVTAIELGAGVAIDVDEERAVRIRGARELHLAASETMTATTEDLRVNAGRASILAKKMEAVALTIDSSFDHARQFGRIVEVVADELSSRLKRSLRFVSEIDQTHARTVDLRAEGVITIHGENTCVTAREITKIDSNQVHIG